MSVVDMLSFMSRIGSHTSDVPRRHHSGVTGRRNCSHRQLPNELWLWTLWLVVQVIPQSFGLHPKIDPDGSSWSAIFVGSWRWLQNLHMWPERYPEEYTGWSRKWHTFSSTSLYIGVTPYNLKNAPKHDLFTSEDPNYVIMTSFNDNNM